MSFLFPQFLFGLFALAIPIIIHLFNFRRTRKVYFSSNKFLQFVKESSKSKLRLKHLLILISRLLFLFFLVMAFAQPVIPAEENQVIQDHISIYLDNSMSMSNEVDEGVTAFEEGIRYVQEILDLYPQNTQFLFLTNDFAPFSNVLKSKSEVSEILTELKLSGVSRSATEISKRLQSSASLFNTDQREIYWVSDFQKSTTGLFDEIEHDTTGTYHAIPLEFNTTNNLFVDSVYLENPFFLAREGNSLLVKIRNSGTVRVDDLLVKLFINDSQASTVTVNIKANSSETIQFDLGFQLEKTYNAGRVSFEEYPVTFDNDFYFTINRTDRINIVEIKSVDNSTSIEKVYGNKELFEFKSFNINNLDYSLLSSADLVVVNSLDHLDIALVSALNEFSDAQGNILFIPGSNPDIESYNLISGMPGLLKIDSAELQLLNPPDLKNPFYSSIFENENENFAMPEARPVIDWTRDRDAILKFRNEEPFLSRYGNGNFLFLMASPLLEDFNGIDRHALFVPIMYKIAASGKRSSNDLYYSLSRSTVTLRLDSLQKDDVVKLQKDNLELIPAQQIKGNELTMELPKNSLSAGFYKVMYENQMKTQIAFDNIGKESILEQYSINELQDFSRKIPNLNVFDSSNAQSFGNEIKERYQGMPLWKYALILALIFLLAEILLIRFL